MPIAHAVPSPLPSNPLLAPPVAVPRRPGVRLLASVEKVTADPTADAVAELIAGLAWTAACGDTCVLTGPVADVRRAVEALRAGDEATARATLDAALRALRAIPVRHHH